MCLGQYGRFISNTKSEARIIPLKGTSDERIPELPDDLDFAYIDGDHTPEQVYKDAIHIFRKMKPGGIVLFDDYQFSVNGVITAEGIDRFLEEHACDLEILFKGVQVAVRKTAR
jgi:predicted O-methyltransferase YrrM